MAELPKISERAKGLAKFDPRNGLKRDAQADAIIALAKRTKDWDLLREAIDHKIADQQDFVAWWKETVTKRHGAGRGNKKNADPGSFSLDAAEKHTGISQQTVSKWGQRLTDIEAYAAMLWGVEYRQAFPDAPDNFRALGTGENEWYTPAEYIAMAYAVMGEIDLDPASNKQAQKTIKAKKFYSKADDGLTKPWHGRVWLNPPYAQPLMGQFMDKMVDEVRADRVTEGIMLTHNYTDAAWFHIGASASSAICFTRGRVAFISADGVPCSPTQGQAFFYFGGGTKKFREVFKPAGFVVTP